MRSCCFTGHRKIQITENLTRILSNNLCCLIEEYGVTDFYSGGAVGWDTLCAQTVINLRRKYPQIRLHLILPCCEEQQTAAWSGRQKAEYREILAAADSVEFISENYYNGCMKKRNARLVELADFCVCYYNEKNSASGTGQTVRMALKKHIILINLYSIEN
ncbi:MAG: SLOG family protein [Oscillospiraceae bacterium]